MYIHVFFETNTIVVLTKGYSCFFSIASIRKKHDRWYSNEYPLYPSWSLCAQLRVERLEF